MFKFICKTVPQLRHSVRTLPTHQLNSLAVETQILISGKANQESFTDNYLINKRGYATKRAIAAAKYANLAVETRKLISGKANQESFTVNYLINRCGLDPKKAPLAAKYVNFDKPDKPDAVISFLKNRGFTETQVLKLVRKFPRLVLCDPEKTLLPKIEFFESKGFSKAHLAVVFGMVPKIFKTSLGRKIIPSFNFLENLLGSVKDIIVAVKGCPLILIDLQSSVAPNIEILRKAGVPDGRIAYILKNDAQVLVRSTDKFKELVDEVEKMGFDPLMSNFVIAVMTIGSITRLNWQKKIELYKRWGSSEDDVLRAFKRYPWCMAASEEKIEGIMEFLVDKMGWESSNIMKSPHIFAFSLNRRIIPRCLVCEVLRSKGLIQGSYSSCHMLRIPERMFLKRFINCYEKEDPELLKIYQENLECST